jgi:MoaA/NifB/PqqE/SkfB family radical SAM enzyme
MEKGMVITVQTNARLLGTPKAKESLAALPNRAVEFVVALHGPTPAIHDNITRVPGSFTETLAAIDTLARLDFPVIGKMVLSRHNVQAIEPTLRLLAERGVLEALVAFPHAEEFSYTALTDVLPDYEQVRTALSVLPDPTCSMRTVYWETIPFCVLPGVDFFPYSIDLTYLKEKTHNRDSEINMTMTEQKILWEPSRKTSKAHAPQCGQCLLEHVCEGVWQEYFSLYTNDALRPIDDAVLVDTFIASLS